MRSRLFLCLWIILSAIAGVNAQGLGECGTGVPAPAWVSACGAVADNAKAAAADRAKALKYRGVFYVRTRDFDKAIKDFGAAIALDGNDAESFNDRALAYQMVGDLAHALPDYDKALVIDPKFQLAWFNRGNARSERGERPQAIADFTQAIALKPDFGPAYRNRGLVKRALGDIDGAITDQTLALQHDANDYDALMARGALLLGKADLDKAVADFSAAIALRPNQSDAYNNRGAALSQKGELGRAAADYDRALLISPGSTGTYSNRGNVRFALGNFGAAADDLERAAKANMRNSYAALWRYLAIARAGNSSTAELLNASRAFDASTWPAPVVDYYLGKISADAVRAAASKGDAQTQAAQQCEAEFYLGEFVLAQAVGQIDPSGIKPDQPDQNLNALDPEAVRQAKPMLARAAEICPAGFTERMGALGELKRMQ